MQTDNKNPAGVNSADETPEFGRLIGKTALGEYRFLQVHKCSACELYFKDRLLAAGGRELVTTHCSSSLLYYLRELDLLKDFSQAHELLGDFLDEHYFVVAFISTSQPSRLRE